MIEPNFFIIGAPKSGTTALSEYLRRHPDVLFSQPKEPHYFNDDFSHRHIDLFDEYLKCFNDQDGGPKSAVGEGSVFYLYSQNAVPNILARYPDARFIVMLRDPVEAAYAWHWQALFSFGESITDFESAWRMQVSRLSGSNIPPQNLVREALHYGPLFLYSNQLERLFNLVPRDQLLIVIYDDFQEDPESIYHEALDFLSLSRFNLESYPRVNASKRTRSRSLEKALVLGGRIKSSLGIKRKLGIVPHIRRLNAVHEERPPLSVQFQSELREYYREDVTRTARLISRDLTTWLRSPHDPPGLSKPG